MHPKDAEGIANSLIWVCTVCPDLSVRKLRNITIHVHLYFQMAKQITQETFDDVVRENVQEFDMTAEEALDDAVKQFESQVVEYRKICTPKILL